MISVQELYDINRYLVEEFGGMGVGFKDENLAESLVVQIYQEVLVKFCTQLWKIRFLI
ncbi:MAG: hypothetical protein ACLR3R_19720 [Clostridium paraputrificum]